MFINYIIITFVMLNQMLNIDNPKKYPISIFFPKGLNAVSIERPLSNAKSGSYTMEIFKDIKGYEGHYKISNKGRVISLSKIRRNGNGFYIQKERMLNPYLNSNGYYRICLSVPIRQYEYIHKLIALAFIPKVKGKNHINHKNCIKIDNRIENLEWCTNSENVKHAHKNGIYKYLKGEETSNSKLKNRDIIEIRKAYKKGLGVKLSKKYHVTHQTIYDIINKKQWAHVK